MNNIKTPSRSEMKKTMAGRVSEGCVSDVCNPIAQACFAAAGYSGPEASACRRQLKCCTRQCSGLSTC